jgi:hypothetical protein
MAPEQEGLYAKYTITNNETGERVAEAFVLKPDVDKHARIAMAAYAESVRPHNPVLAADLKYWLSQINVDPE